MISKVKVLQKSDICLFATDSYCRAEEIIELLIQKFPLKREHFSIDSITYDSGHMSDGSFIKDKGHEVIYQPYVSFNAVMNFLVKQKGVY
jgi:phosphoheptose isomerase